MVLLLLKTTFLLSVTKFWWYWLLVKKKIVGVAMPMSVAVPVSVSIFIFVYLHVASWKICLIFFFSNMPYSAHSIECYLVLQRGLQQLLKCAQNYKVQGLTGPNDFSRIQDCVPFQIKYTVQHPISDWISIIWSSTWPLLVFVGQHLNSDVSSTNVIIQL